MIQDMICEFEAYLKEMDQDNSGRTVLNSQYKNLAGMDKRRIKSAKAILQNMILGV